MYEIVYMDNLEYLRLVNSRKYTLAYIDPPFNTGKSQKIHGIEYNDKFEDYLSFLKKRLVLLWEALTDNGSLFVHLDWREVHYVKVMMDELFGRDKFMNEIIWAYDYGGRPKSYWPRKHDNILWYVKNPKDYIFNYDEMDRIPYMSPGLVGKEKAAKGKTPTDVWWHTIVPTNSKERVGYPTQKPLGILNRIVKIHSNPYDWVIDIFAGSGSFGEAAVSNYRDVVLVDNNPEAINIMSDRLERCRL